MVQFLFTIKSLPNHHLNNPVDWVFGLFKLDYHKYMENAAHHEWHTALFSVHRAGFNIYSLTPLFFICLWFAQSVGFFLQLLGLLA